MILPNDAILLDELIAYGHPNVLATHRTTIEITTEDFLTERGNCIIAIRSNKAVNDFSDELKKAILTKKKIFISLKSDNYDDSFVGYGSESLSLTNKISIVFRVSSFISDRTALIQCSKSSNLLNRKLIRHLNHPENQLHVKFYKIFTEKQEELDLNCLNL